MKQITLTQGKVALVDDEDYDFLNQWKWHTIKQKCGFYAVRNSSRTLGTQRKIKMERVILGITNHDQLGDHIDHDGLNNQRNNLRVATRAQNNCNKKAKKNGSSKYLGVSVTTYLKNHSTGLKEYSYWRAGIFKDGVTQTLGCFKKEADAAMAYNKAAIELHGEFANLNNIVL